MIMAGTTRPPAAREAATLLEQLHALTDRMVDLTADEYARPSMLTGWDVCTLCRHIQTVALQFADNLETAGVRTSDRRRLPAALLMRRSWPDPRPDESSSTADTGSKAGADPGSEMATVTHRLESLLCASQQPAAIQTPDGTAKLADAVRVRIVQAVVHADDLSQSLPQRGPVPTPRKALGIACRTLADILAEEHPGKSVELRVPPFVAVQCGTGSDGPTHTRGTPPNVIESDPMIFLRLATGRLTWADAKAEVLVSASGQRADLSTVLPVIS